jgi:hypothetical protein
MDPFENFSDSLIAPAKHAFTITPDDNADLPVATKALYIGNGGDVVVRPVESAQDVAFVNVPAGAILPVRARAIRTSSTATDMVGLI